MRKIRRARCLRPLAWLTTVALMAILLPPPAAAQTAPRATVAVVQVANQSGSSVQNLAARAASALNAALAGSGLYNVVGQQAVDAALTAAGVRLPLRPATRDGDLLALARALNADYLVLASIDSVESDTGRQVAVIKSTLNVFGKQAEGDVALVETTAFNLTRTDNEALLLDDALEQNALYAARGMVTNLGLVGKVTAPALENTVRLSFRDSHYLRAGAQFVLLRNGVRYALAELKSAKTGDAEAHIFRYDREAIRPAVNDEVRLYRQGTGPLAPHDPDWDPVKDQPTAAEKGRRNTATLWAAIGGVALLGLGAWALLAGNSSRDDKRTTSLVSPPDNAILQVDADNVLTSPVSFTGTSVKSANLLTLEIAGDPGFGTLAYTETKTGVTSDTGGTGGGTGQTVIDEPTVVVSFTPTTSTGGGTTGAFLPPGTYFWRVITVVGSERHVSNVFRFTVVRQGSGGTGGAGTLASPATVNALAGNGVVELQWTPVSGATGYEVWRRLLTPRFANGVAGSRTFRPATGANIWLRGTARRSPREDRPNPREVFGSGAVRQSSAGLAGFSRIASVGGATLSYTDTTVSNGTEYQWVVLTVNPAGTTPLEQAQAGSFATTTPLGTAPPATPSGLTAVAGDGQVVLSWNPNTEADLAGYQVFRSLSPSGNFVDITANLVTDSQSPATQGLSAGPADIGVVDSPLTNGVTVYYRLRAVQMTTVVNGTTRGGLESSLSELIQATPTAAAPQELQVLQPPSGSTIDADRPQLAWRGVDGASEYTLQFSSDPTFQAAGLIQTTASDTEIIYPASLPALQEGTQYYFRVGVFDTSQQALRFGPTSTFTRGAVQRFTTSVATTLDGAPLNGARLAIDGVESGEISPAQFILAPKTNNAAYILSAVFDDVDGRRFSGQASYKPGIDAADVVIPLSSVGTAPATPTGLSATGQTDRIVLRWNPDRNLGVAGATVAASYSLRRRSNTEEGQYTEIARVTAPTTAQGSAADLIYTDFNVRTGVRYYYRVVALSAAGIDSQPSVTANAVAGIGVIQVVSPQDNQTFGVAINNNTWTTTIDFSWLAVAGAARYVFEIGTDPDLHTLLANGNELINASAAPGTSVTLGQTAPTGFTWVDDGAANTVTLYWRVVAVDETSVILNQTEARRLFVNQPGLVATP